MYKNKLTISKPWWRSVVYYRDGRHALDTFSGDRVTIKGIMRVKATRDWPGVGVAYKLTVTFVSRGELWVISDRPYCDGSLDTWMRHIKTRALKLYREVER